MAGYGTDEGFAAWLSANGYALPDNAPAPAILRQRGSDYLDGLYGARFRGAPAGGLAQERAWPRVNATANGEDIPSDIIPASVINASYAAAYAEAQSPGSLSVTVTTAAAVKREKVASLETEYFPGSGDAVRDATPLLSSVEGLLASLIMPLDPPLCLGLWSIG